MVAVRKDYVAPTGLENLMILISTNMPRLTALEGFHSRPQFAKANNLILGIHCVAGLESQFRVVRGQNGTAKYANNANKTSLGNGFGATAETATGTGALPGNVPVGGRAPWWPSAKTRPMAVWGGRTGQRTRREISRRDFINQPGVARCNRATPGNETKMQSTLKGLNPSCQMRMQPRWGCDSCGTVIRF